VAAKHSGSARQFDGDLANGLLGAVRGKGLKHGIHVGFLKDSCEMNILAHKIHLI
jgi:hypothetical protein